MKKLIAFLIGFITLTFLYSGCSNSNSKVNLNTEDKKLMSTLVPTPIGTDTTPIINKNVSTNPFANIKCTDIKWITKMGGLPKDKGWVVLFPQRDEKIINKIINLINSSLNVQVSSKKDLEFLNGKGGYPVDIVIKMNDQSEFDIKTAISIKETKKAQSVERIGTTLMDKFILAYQSAGEIKYYTCDSKEVADYLIHTSYEDFPLTVEQCIVTPPNFKIGDAVVVTGGGSVDDEINVCLTSGNAPDTEIDIIGKVKPVLGTWRWEGVINNKIKTFDGKTIAFRHNKMRLEVRGAELLYYQSADISSFMK